MHAAGLRGLVPVVGRADFIDELRELFPFSFAHIEEADADFERIIDGLGDAGEAEGQALDAKFDFNPSEDADWKSSLGANAAAAQADIANLSTHIRCQINQPNDG